MKSRITQTTRLWLEQYGWSPKRFSVLCRLCRTRLLVWFRRYRRRLPWRARRTPYRVWVAEIMLQQTRAEQAASYYRRFVRRFPSVRALALASQQEVLKMWEGLGYYVRARNLHRAARQIVRDWAGRFPKEAAEWLKLPGVGEYTAAAIVSLAFNKPTPVLDGNVVRVLSRIFAIPEDPRRLSIRSSLRAVVRDIMPKTNPGRFNEAMMELGALCCTPRRPHCEECPFRTVCEAFCRRRVADFPVRRGRKPRPHKVVGAGIVVNSRGQVLLSQRRESSMLGGLWEFPGGTQEPSETIERCIQRELKEELGVETYVGPLFRKVRHEYSHFTIELHSHWAVILAGRPKPIHCAAVRWVSLSELGEFPLARADRMIADALEEEGLKDFRRWKSSLIRPRRVATTTR